MRDPGKNRHTGAPTWPRLDLVPPKHALRVLRDWGRVILASRNYLNEEDRAIVERAVQQLHEASLAYVSGTLTVDQILAIAGAAYVIGAHGAMTDTAHEFFKQSQAQFMRERRETSPRKQVIRAAITAEMKAIGGTIPSEHPWKDAETILDPVNRRVSDWEAGNVDDADKCKVKIGVIARQLQPRSSRTRKK